MDPWIISLAVVGIILLCCLIFGLPRKQIQRVPSFEGIDDPAVAEAFEWVTNFGPYRILRNQFIRRLKKMKPQGTLVDLGCGSGKFIIEIAKTFPDKDALELIGVDIAEEMVAIAQANAEAHNQGTRITFKVGSGARMPFADESVDLILSTFSLHHWGDPVAVVEEIYRVLKPGGRVVIFDFRRDARKAFYGLFTFTTYVAVPAALKRVKEPLGSIRAAYTPSEARGIFAQTSFKAVKFEPMFAWIFLSGQKV